MDVLYVSIRFQGLQPERPAATYIVRLHGNARCQPVP